MVCATAIAVNPGRRAAPDELPLPTANRLTAHRRFDRGHVDLLHFHHRRERPRCNLAAGGHRLGQHARRDLPRHAPLVLAPAAGAFSTAIANDRVPVTVGLRLILGGDLERERLALLEHVTAVEAETRDAADRESTVSTCPARLPGKLLGARSTCAGAVGEGLRVELAGLFGVLLEL